MTYSKSAKILKHVQACKKIHRGNSYGKFLREIPYNGHVAGKKHYKKSDFV